jgi:putative selenium metabolism protein SsnA
MTVLLANATLATLYPPMLRFGHLDVQGDRIQSVLETVPPGMTDDVVECSGKLVIPGNVCAHTHLYSALARGMPGPRVQPTNFLEILQLIWWRLDRALNEPSIRASALVGAIDAVRAGTTTLVDHHASPNAILGSLDMLADGLESVGMRAVLCYEVTDRDGRERRDQGLRENDRFLAQNRRGSIRGNVGAHASFTLEDGSLSRLAELARHHDTGVHIHVAEAASDEEDSLRRSGRRVASRLADAGILNAESIAAHGVHLDEREIGLIHAHGSWLVHNCRSNMNNGVGFGPVARFGEKAALGTDGIDGDMFAESRTAFFRSRESDLSTSAESIAAMLAGGATLASSYFSAPLGRIEAGGLADLVVLNYDPPTELGAANLAWHWMFGLSAEQVESVMVGGKWILRKGEIVGVDEEQVRADARQEAHQLWQRMDEL